MSYVSFIRVNFLCVMKLSFMFCGTFYLKSDNRFSISEKGRLFLIYFQNNQLELYFNRCANLIYYCDIILLIQSVKTLVTELIIILDIQNITDGIP